jgi:hypothetical protein
MQSYLTFELFHRREDDKDFKMIIINQTLEDLSNHGERQNLFGFSIFDILVVMETICYRVTSWLYMTGVSL